MSDLTPVRRSLVVPLTQQAAFDLFVRRMTEWWPLATRSVLLTGAVACHFEPRRGGRVFERGRDGREEPWGRVLVWEEPRRVAFTWHPGMPEQVATEVEVMFTPSGRQTLVELEHSHWERLGERAALVRAFYDGGWPGVLARFAELATGAQDLSAVVGRGCAEARDG